MKKLLLLLFISNFSLLTVHADEGPSRTAWSTSEAIALVWLYRLMDSCLPTTIAVSRPSAPIPPLSTTIC